MDKVFRENFECSNPISSQLACFTKFTSCKDAKFLKTTILGLKSKQHAKYLTN